MAMRTEQMYLLAKTVTGKPVSNGMKVRTITGMKRSVGKFWMNTDQSKCCISNNLCMVCRYCLPLIIYVYCKMSAPDVQFFFTMRDQIKLYHWQTLSYSRHKATDAVIEKLDGLIDSFAEVYFGTYGRPRLTTKTNTVVLRNISDKSISTFIKDCISYIAGPLSKSLKKSDTDLMNIRDEMLAELHQLLYLFSLD